MEEEAAMTVARNPVKNQMAPAVCLLGAVQRNLLQVSILKCLREASILKCQSRNN